MHGYRILQDIHSSGDWLITSGIDHIVRMWDLKVLEEKEKLISKSDQPTGNRNPKKVSTPAYSCGEIHASYVDCVRFYGDMIFSKSIENKIVCWSFILNPNNLRDNMRNEGSYFYKHFEFQLSDCGIWFVKFEINFQKQLIFIGNASGEVCIFKIPNGNDLSECIYKSFTHVDLLALPKPATIRQVSLNFDSNRVVAVDDNSTVWFMDLSTSTSCGNVFGFVACSKAVIQKGTKTQSRNQNPPHRVSPTRVAFTPMDIEATPTVLRFESKPKRLVDTSIFRSPNHKGTNAAAKSTYQAHHSDEDENASIVLVQAGKQRAVQSAGNVRSVCFFLFFKLYL